MTTPPSRSPRSWARERALTRGFLTLESHHLFDHHFCRVGRGNEKGHVENHVGYSPAEPVGPGPVVPVMGGAERVPGGRLLCRPVPPGPGQGRDQGRAPGRGPGRHVGAAGRDLRAPTGRPGPCQLALPRAFRPQRLLGADRLCPPRSDRARRDRRGGHHAAGPRWSPATPATGAKSTSPSTRSTTWPSWSESPVPSTSPGRSRTGGCPGASPRLRRRLEADLGHKGTREFIKVLRLLENATLPALTKAVESAIAIGATGSDAIALILFHHAEQPVGLFSLDGHPHLKAVAIEPPDLSAYRALTARLTPGMAAHVIPSRHVAPTHQERSNTMKATRPSPGALAPPPEGAPSPDGGGRVREGGHPGRRGQRRPPRPTSSASPSWNSSNGRNARPNGGSKAARFPDHQDARDLRLRRPALGQQGAGRRADALRVHRQEGEHLDGRQPRDRESPTWPRPWRPRRVPRATGSGSSAPPSW